MNMILYVLFLVVLQLLGLLLGIVILAFLLFWASFALYRFSELYSRWYFKIFGKRTWKFFIFPFFVYYFKYKYVQKNKEFESEKPHIALILANNWFPERYLSYDLDIKRIVKYLKDNKKPYKVYDELNSSQIKAVINNKKVTSVLLFGHGSKHSVQTGKNEILTYCEFNGSHKKDFIAQFHCNHGNGKSLRDYISKKESMCFITDSTQRDADINKQIDKIIKDKLI